MIETVVGLSSDALLAVLADRGLVVKLETVDGKRASPHWHLGIPKKPGVLEITDQGDQCLLKVAANRDGGWANDLVSELGRAHPAPPSRP